jgi:hypothetical protein
MRNAVDSMDFCCAGVKGPDVWYCGSISARHAIKKRPPYISLRRQQHTSFTSQNPIY